MELLLAAFIAWPLLQFLTPFVLQSYTRSIHTSCKEMMVSEGDMMPCAMFVLFYPLQYTGLILYSVGLVLCTLGHLVIHLISGFVIAAYVNKGNVTCLVCILMGMQMLVLKCIVETEVPCYLAPPVLKFPTTYETMVSGRFDRFACTNLILETCLNYMHVFSSIWINAAVLTMLFYFTVPILSALIKK